MKKLKQMISLIMVLCLICGNMVHAETDTTQGDSLFYERMYEAYQEGNQMDDWVVEERKKIAKELGLIEHLDDRSFLSLNYIHENDLDLSDKKLNLLVEMATKEEEEMILVKGMIQTMSVDVSHGAVNVVQMPRVDGAYNGYFGVSNGGGSADSFGYCAENNKNYWNNGGVHAGNVYEWDNATARRVLYYAPGGPGYAAEHSWGSQAVDMDYATCAISYLNIGDSHNNSMAIACINYVNTLKDPFWYGYKAYKADMTHYYEGKECQDIAFLNYAGLGTIEVVKRSSNPDLTNDNENYSLEGAVFGIFTEYAGRTNWDYDPAWDWKLTTAEYSKNGEYLGVPSGEKYGWLEISVPEGDYWVQEITPPEGFSLNNSWSEKITVTNGEGRGSNVVTIINEPMITTGELGIYKSSARPELTNNNLCYSLEGAEYGVYSDEKCTNEIGTLITDENGVTPHLTLTAGKYWVKEKKAPKGFALDLKPYPITVKAGNIEILNVEDLPQMDPVGVLLGKINKETNDNKPVNSLTLEGALYEFKFYGIQLDDPNQDPATLGEEALKNIMQETWVFRTNSNGFTYYDEQYKVSGPNIHKAADGCPALPIGTLTIRELEAPEGYLKDETVYVRQILADGNDQYVETYNYPIVPEATFDLDVIKIQEGTEVGIPGAVFEHTKPDGTTEILTTDENGRLSFKALNYGNHELREVSAPEGYIKNENVITYSIATNNSVTFTSQNDNTVSLSVSEEGNVQAIYYEKIYPFSFVIHKQNDKGTSLEAAEFVLYADAECTQVVQSGITGADGMIRIDNLTAFTKYYLKETKAPPGYAVMTDEEGNPLVTEIYVSIIPARNEFKLYVNGTEYDFASQGDFSFSGTKEAYVLNMTVINELGYVLPQTGSSLTIILALAGILMFVVNISPHNMKKKKL